MPLTPTHDLVFIKRAEEEQTGAIIVATLTNTEPVGFVVAHGPGKTYSTGEIVPLDVQVGDKVIFSKHAGQTFKVDGDELIALREADIYAIV